MKKIDDRRPDSLRNSLGFHRSLCEKSGRYGHEQSHNHVQPRLFSDVHAPDGILLYDRSLLKIRIRDLWIFIAAGLIGTLGLNFCYNESISRLTLSLSAVLLSLAPVSLSS